VRIHGLYQVILKSRRQCLRSILHPGKCRQRDRRQRCLIVASVAQHIEAAPGGREFARRFLDEVVSIVRRVGSPPSESFLETAAATLTAPGSPLTSSMYRDLQKGSPIEADQIIGDLLARGREQTIDAPLLAAAYTSLSMHQRRSSNPRAP
jgi:2-dehydropantoate 2-reductase